MKKRQINTEKLYQAVIVIIVAILVLVSLFPLIYVMGKNRWLKMEGLRSAF